MKDNYSESETFLEPLKRLKRVDPPPSVWEGIVTSIEQPEARQVSMIAWPRAVAAAAIVLLLNTAGIFYAAQSSTQVASNQTLETSLVSDFQLYE